MYTNHIKYQNYIRLSVSFKNESEHFSCKLLARLLFSSIVFLLSHCEAGVISILQMKKPRIRKILHGTCRAGAQSPHIQFLLSLLSSSMPLQGDSPSHRERKWLFFLLPKFSVDFWTCSVRVGVVSGH